MKFFTTNETEQWVSHTNAPGEINTTLSLSEEHTEPWEGFGGCFNELSKKAINTLPDEEQRRLYDTLFSADADGLRLEFCRLPIGASDYAELWYSHNENDGDYEMEKFSICRDQLYLIPYIKEALKRNPRLRLFASPWSPPAWMKTHKTYNHGTLVWDERTLKAYALYFLKFVQAYEAEGITIDQIHVQNEPMSSQKFPSCIWTGPQFAEFIGKYLGPLFEENHIRTKIWLGTLNGPETDWRAMHTRYNDYANYVLHDKEAYKYIEGISYQWAGKYAVQITKNSFPEKKIMQSENECGDGENTWRYANYIFELFHHYITNGVCVYTYWNMVLPPKGESSWGWCQNSMVTVEKDTAVLNYEYYVMKHFSRYVHAGSKRLGLKGHFSGNSVAFRTPEGQTVLICQNPFDRVMTFEWEGELIGLPARSINTVVI